MKIVVVSGKGGTGKTTLAGSLAYLMDSDVIKVDCDVDAANLNLLLNGHVREKKTFSGSGAANVTDQCNGCGVCIDHCKYDAIKIVGGKAEIHPFKCEGCGVCTLVCPNDGVILKAEDTGHVMFSETKVGKLTHAELFPGADGSGKMVTAVRKRAEKESHKHQLIDGSPGVGCAVMASVTGCDLGVLVTEPTLSGLEDLKRIHLLLNDFKIPVQLVINKFDLNEAMTEALITYALENNVDVIGKIPFDSSVQKAINSGIPVVAVNGSPAGEEIKAIHKLIERCM